MRINDNIVQAFVTYSRTKDLIAVTGLSKQSICKLKKDKELQIIVSQYRADMMQDVVSRLQKELFNSIDILCAIRDDADVNPQTRVVACNSIINHCNQFTTTNDIIQRIQELEELTKEYKN